MTRQGGPHPGEQPHGAQEGFEGAARAGSVASEGYGQWAHVYRNHLWTGVLPLAAGSKSEGLPGGYTGRKAGDRYPDDDQIARWVRTRASGNLALRMPSDVIGIDVDDYEYSFQRRDLATKELMVRDDGSPWMETGVKTGNVTLGALEDELGELPATWRSSSRGDGPSGIRFYRVPPGLLWGDFGIHLEAIWWGHRYAVVWPSTNPDSGMRYLWINETSDDPQWGAPPPKVTDLPELPSAWVARFGRSADQPRLPVAPKQAGQLALYDGAGERADGPDPNRPHRFTRAQAERYVEEKALARLRATHPGDINNQINNAAMVFSHFVPAFWSVQQATYALMAAVAHTAYDDQRAAMGSVNSGLNAISWVAELVPETLAAIGGAHTRPRATESSLWPTGGPQDGDEPPEASGFWDARPVLGYIRDFALHRYAAPWAVLGATLARAATAVEPNIQLPAIIGTEASLNLFVGLVGQSGGGKDIAVGVSEALLLPTLGHHLMELDTIPLGSGEGLSHIFMRPPVKTGNKRSRRFEKDDDSELIGLGVAGDPDSPIQYRSRALVNIAEIDTMGSLSQRRGSTIGGQLRQAWSGSQLGFQYVDMAKRMIVPKHAYRLCLTAGIQPLRAGVLLDETDGGTPQRFLWMPAQSQFDDLTDEQIDNPDPGYPAMSWTPPVCMTGTATYDVCATARRTIVRAHIARGRGEGDALDGHSLLNRLKTAAALAMLSHDQPQRQCQITEEDWELAGTIMEISDATRGWVQRALADDARVENEKKAIAEAHKTIVVGERVEDDGVKKVARWLRGRISTEWLTERELSRASSSKTRDFLGQALDRMVETGELESQEYHASGVTATKYRRKE